jgi:hypothetical protein
MQHNAMCRLSVWLICKENQQFVLQQQQQILHTTEDRSACSVAAATEDADQQSQTVLQVWAAQARLPWANAFTVPDFLVLHGLLMLLLLLPLALQFALLDFMNREVLAWNVKWVLCVRAATRLPRQPRTTEASKSCASRAGQQPASGQNR